MEWFSEETQSEITDLSPEDTLAPSRPISTTQLRGCLLLPSANVIRGVPWLEGWLPRPGVHRQRGLGIRGSLPSPQAIKPGGEARCWGTQRGRNTKSHWSARSPEADAALWTERPSRKAGRVSASHRKVQMETGAAPRGSVRCLPVSTEPVSTEPSRTTGLGCCEEQRAGSWKLIFGLNF